MDIPEEGFARPRQERIRFFDKPDYTRPPLEIPEESRKRMLARFAFLYGKKRALETMPELERICWVDEVIF